MKGLLLAALLLVGVASSAGMTAMTPTCPSYNMTTWNATYWDFSAPISLGTTYTVDPTTYQVTMQGANFTVDDAKKNFTDYWTMIKPKLTVMNISGSAASVAYGETWSVQLATPPNSALGVVNTTASNATSADPNWQPAVYVTVSNVTSDVWNAAAQWKSNTTGDVMELVQSITCNYSMPSIRFIDTNYINSAGSGFNDSDAIAYINKVLGTTLGSNITKATHYPLPAGVTMPAGYQMPPIPPPVTYYVRRITWPIQAGGKDVGVLAQSTLFSSAADAQAGRNASSSSYEIEVNAANWTDAAALGAYVKDIEAFMIGLN